LPSPEVTTREDVAQRVLDALEEVAGRPLGPLSDLHDVSLGKNGLALDSIEIVEALIALEDSTGTPFGTLLEDGPPTFGAVIEHFAGA
jgi:acyl carrier protein